jgi:hypothetical protein
MARAPARWAPSIKAWLRGFGKDSGTGKLLPFLPEFFLRTKSLGHHPVWMMAPKLWIVS